MAKGLKKSPVSANNPGKKITGSYKTNKSQNSKLRQGPSSGSSGS